MLNSNFFFFFLMNWDDFFLEINQLNSNEYLNKFENYLDNLYNNFENKSIWLNNSLNFFFQN